MGSCSQNKLKIDPVGTSPPPPPLPKEMEKPESLALSAATLPKLKEKADSGSGSLLELPNMERTLRLPELSPVSMDSKLKKEPPRSSLVGDVNLTLPEDVGGDDVLLKRDTAGCFVGSVNRLA